MKVYKSIYLFIERHQRLKKIFFKIYNPTIVSWRKKRKSKILKIRGFSILEELMQIMKNNEVSFWLDFGTLLGIYRDGDFIDHDLDIDISMWLGDFHECLYNELSTKGFKKIKEYSIDNGKYGLQFTFVKKGICIDVFFYTRVNSRVAYYHDFVSLPGISRIKTLDLIGGFVPREYTMIIESIGDIEFNGVKFPVPLPVDEHLKSRYGEAFMTKDLNWNIEKGNRSNVKYLSNKVGIFKEF